MFHMARIQTGESRDYGLSLIEIKIFYGGKYGSHTNT